MSNLIVTIISIVLVGIAVIMGVYYGGQAFNTASTTALLNAFLNQNSQLIAAAQQFSLDNGGATIVPECGLYNGHYIQTWPNVIDQPPTPAYGTMQNAGVDLPNWSTGSSNGTIYRVILNYNGNFMILTTFTISAGGKFEDAANINTEPVRIALAFNKSAKAQVPTGLTYAPSGIPYNSGAWTIVNSAPALGAPVSSSGCTGSPPRPNITSFNADGVFVYLDASGNLLTNMCVVGTGGNAIFMRCWQS